MFKAVGLFNRSKNSRPFKDYHAEWFSNLKNNLLPLLRRSLSGSSPTLLSIHVEMLHNHFQSYYYAQDSAATADVGLILFPDWRNSLEKPLLWIGDLHPYLFINLVRSFLEDESDDETDQNNGFSESGLDQFRESCELFDKPWQIAMAWRNPSETLTKRIDQIECGLRLIVPTLTSRMKDAESVFVDHIVENWFRCRGRKEAKVAVGAVLTEHMEELVSIFVDANRLRRSVLAEIISATGVYEAALFLEGLSQFLIGFRDHDLVTAVERCKSSFNQESSSRH